MTAHAQTHVILATATPGGGFPLFGDNAAAVINETDPSLAGRDPATPRAAPRTSACSKQGKLDIALVAGEPAYEAFAGIGRAPTNLKIIQRDLFQPRHVRGAAATARRRRCAI